MAFRDDREVLKQKARDLERDLAAAESKLEAQKGEADRVEKLEQELAEARGMLNRIEAQLPKPPSNPRNARNVALLVGLAVTGAGMMLLLTRSSQPPVIATVVQAATAVPLPPTVPPAPLPVVSAPVTEVTAHWVGKAKTVTGSAIKPGLACAVEAVLRSNNKHDVTVSCGDEVLYRSTDELSGMSQMKTGAAESPAEKPGMARATLLWSDVGARTGARTQASIDSQAGVASAWRETAPSYRVDIAIPELSEAYDGAFDPKHSADALPFKGRIEARAKVTKTGGRAPINVGAACVIALSPQWSAPLDCRANLRCGDRVLYGSGSTGYSKCEVADGRPTAFRDETQEGDPMLTWDLTKGTIALVVEAGGTEWSADFSVVTQAQP